MTCIVGMPTADGVLLVSDRFVEVTGPMPDGYGGVIDAYRSTPKLLTVTAGSCTRVFGFGNLGIVIDERGVHNPADLALDWWGRERRPLREDTLRAFGDVLVAWIATEVPGAYADYAGGVVGTVLVGESDTATRTLALGLLVLALGADGTPHVEAVDVWVPTVGEEAGFMAIGKADGLQAALDEEPHAAFWRRLPLIRDLSATRATARVVAAMETASRDPNIEGPFDAVLVGPLGPAQAHGVRA